MKPETELQLRAALDFVWDSCVRDSQGNIRPDSERMSLYSRYIGWLEGIALSNLTDEQAHDMMRSIQISIQIVGANDAADEATLHDDEDGSFY